METEKQWKRAVVALKEASELDRATAWKLFSSDTLEKDSSVAIIMLSQYKALFKNALKEALKSDIVHVPCTQCSDNVRDTDAFDLLKEYKDELQEYVNFLSWFTINIKPRDEDGHEIVYELSRTHAITPPADQTTISELKESLERILTQSSATLEQKLSEINELKDQISSTTGSIAAIAESSAALARATATQPVTSKLAELESKLSETNGAISAIAASVAVLGAVVPPDLSSRIAEMGGQLTQLRKAVIDNSTTELLAKLDTNIGMKIEGIDDLIKRSSQEATQTANRNSESIKEFSSKIESNTQNKVDEVSLMFTQV